MPKIDIDDKQFAKMVDDAGKARIKTLEKEVKSLTSRLAARDSKIAKLEAKVSEHNRAIEAVDLIHGILSEWCPERDHYCL